MTGTRGHEVTCKAHVSTGQFAKHYMDPRTGKPINFNFLTHFADPRTGLLVHTVQAYALDDPAPTYGRLAIIHCDGRPAVELVEIVAPDRVKEGA